MTLNKLITQIYVKASTMLKDSPEYIKKVKQLKRNVQKYKLTQGCMNSKKVKERRKTVNKQIKFSNSLERDLKGEMILPYKFKVKLTPRSVVKHGRNEIMENGLKYKHLVQ